MNRPQQSETPTARAAVVVGDPGRQVAVGVDAYVRELVVGWYFQDRAAPLGWIQRGDDWRASMDRGEPADLEDAIATLLADAPQTWIAAAEAAADQPWEQLREQWAKELATDLDR